MHLNLGRGIDNLTFGLTQSDVVGLLGEPSKVFTDEDDSNELIWQYNTQKLRLSFYQDEGGRLGYIRTTNPSLTYLEQPLVGEPIARLLGSTLSDLGSWEIEHYPFFDMYFNEEHWLVLNVEYDMVTDIEVGVLPGNEGNYNWPIL